MGCIGQNAAFYNQAVMAFLRSDASSGESSMHISETEIHPERTAAMSSKPMQRARVDGAELEYEITGAGEPVVLIHGALIAEAFAPLCAEPALRPLPAGALPPARLRRQLARAGAVQHRPAGRRLPGAAAGAGHRARPRRRPLRPGA